MRPNCAAHPDIPHQVGVDDSLDIGIGNFFEQSRSSRTGVVHQNIDSTPGIDCALNDSLCGGGIADILSIGHSFTAGAPNFLRHRLAACLVKPAAAIRANTKIVDNDLRSPRGKQHGEASPKIRLGPTRPSHY